MNCIKRMLGLAPVVRIEVYQGADGLWYFRGKTRNGEIVFPSEGYTRRESAVDTAKMLTTAKLVLEDQ